MPWVTCMFVGILEIANQEQLPSSCWPGHTRALALTHTYTLIHTQMHTHTHLEGACCQLFAWQTKNILVVYKYGPNSSWDTSQVQAHLCQVLPRLGVFFHPYLHSTLTVWIDSEVLSPKHLSWTVSQAASVVSWFVLFSLMLLKCYFFHSYTTTSHPSQIGLLEKMFILLFLGII